MTGFLWGLANVYTIGYTSGGNSGGSSIVGTDSTPGLYKYEWGTSPEYDLKQALKLNIPYPEAGFGYSGRHEIVNNFEKIMMEKATLVGLPESDLLATIMSSLVWGYLDSQNPMLDIPDKRKVLINKAVYEYNRRLEDPFIKLLAYGVDVYKYSKGKARLQNILFGTIECGTGALTALVDKALFGDLPISSTIVQPRLPRVEEGDITLLINIIYTYHKYTPKGEELVAGVFKESLAPLERWLKWKPRESRNAYYLMTLELQMRQGKVLEAIWDYIEYYNHPFVEENFPLYDPPKRRFKISTSSL